MTVKHLAGYWFAECLRVVDFGVSPFVRHLRATDYTEAFAFAEGHASLPRRRIPA